MEKIRILFVEDDKNLRRIFDMGLSDTVFEKFFAEDGTKALELYTAWRPEIIILDIMLPEVSGYAVLKAIREEKDDKATIIVMATSLSDKATVMDCLKLGIQGYLVKPFTHKEILDKITEHLRKVNPERAASMEAELQAETVEEQEPK
ncbi:MAG: response regulator [Syntrophobacteraceae bacterium]